MGTSANSARSTTSPPKSANESWWIRHHLVHRSALDNPEFGGSYGQGEAKGAVTARKDVDVDVDTLRRIGAKSRLAVPGRLSHLETPVRQLADRARDGIGEKV
jgi:hypothetical protein